MKRDLVDIISLSRDEIDRLMERTTILKAKQKEGGSYTPLQGKTLGFSDIRVVRVGTLSSAGDEIRIEPRFMKVNPGTVVVWWNKGREEIKVLFTEGAKCEAGTGVPTGFHVEAEADKCFITAYIRPGETSSLRFLSEDIYEYEVRIGGRSASTGKIVVADKDIYL